MKKALKSSSFLFYFLVLIVFFILGGSFSGYMEVGKNQGLAGAAIVLGHALMYALGALILAIFLASRLKTRFIIYSNFMLFTLLSILIFIGYLKHLEKQKSNIHQPQYPKNPTPTVPVKSIQKDLMPIE